MADKILAGVRRNRFLIYTSADIRALYLFKRTMWWPYSVAMRRVNVVFTRALRPTPQARLISALPQSHGGVSSRPRPASFVSPKSLTNSSVGGVFAQSSPVAQASA